VTHWANEFKSKVAQQLEGQTCTACGNLALYIRKIGRTKAMNIDTTYRIQQQQRESRQSQCEVNTCKNEAAAWPGPTDHSAPAQTYPKIYMVAIRTTPKSQFLLCQYQAVIAEEPGTHHSPDFSRARTCS
jgi:hypothetical protein